MKMSEGQRCQGIRFTATTDSWEHLVGMPLLDTVSPRPCILNRSDTTPEGAKYINSTLYV